MTRPSCKQKVKAVFPNAIAVEDLNAGFDLYDSEWADSAKFTIGYFENSEPIDMTSASVFKTTYENIVSRNSWVFLSGWRKTELEAWKAAWKFIEINMLKTFEK